MTPLSLATFFSSETVKQFANNFDLKQGAAKRFRVCGARRLIPYLQLLQ